MPVNSIIVVAVESRRDPVTVNAYAADGIFYYLSPQAERHRALRLTSPALLKRDKMLALLERLEEHKQLLREKYGEFDVDKDIRAMREERLAYLEELVDGDDRS